MSSENYHSIISHYEDCLAKHGDTHLGVDWPKQEDAQTRYKIMLDVIRPPRPAGVVRLLDFGCGASHLYEYLRAQKMRHVAYAGLDLSNKFVELSRAKFPSNRYYSVDLLKPHAAIPDFHYIVMNGVFTEKRELAFDEMFSYFKRLLIAVFARAEVGLAFNVMSKHVDWERDDLFHVSFDVMAKFLTAELTRNFIFRQDYGLYEYTVYAYR